MQTVFQSEKSLGIVFITESTKE